MGRISPSHCVLGVGLLTPPLDRPKVASAMLTQLVLSLEQK